MIRRRALAATVAGLALVATACSSSSSPVHPGPTATSDRNAALIAKAHLAPCPTSSARPVAGGLPNLTLDCLGHGPAVHLAGLIGSPTVVNLWGSWCGPCQLEAGFLSSTYDADRATVRFLGVDIEDDPASALDFGAHVSPPVRYPSVVDPDKKLLLALHFQGPPETAFLSSAGTIVHIHSGQYTSAAQLRADLATYLHVT